MRKIAVFFTIMMLALASFAQGNAEKICGTYLVIEKSEVSKVKVTRKPNGDFEGKIIWMQNPKFEDGSPKTDVKNPDPAKRNTPADKIVLLHNFKYDASDDEWSGEIYNPVEGDMYKAYAKFESPKKLKVRGYVGLPIFGRSMYWVKLDE